MADHDICPLCERPLGVRREKHHLVPKSLGGRDMVALHPICHRKIHQTLSEREIKRSYATIDTLQAHPDIKAFIKWVKKKEPDFYKATARSRSR